MQHINSSMDFAMRWPPKFYSTQKPDKRCGEDIEFGVLPPCTTEASIIQIKNFLILECKFIRAGRKHRERFKQAFSTRWKFTYLEFSTCSTCLHQKKSYVVVRIIDLLMTLMTSVRGVHYIRTVTPILGHGSVKVSSFWCKCPSAPGGDTLYLLCPKLWYSPNQ